MLPPLVGDSWGYRRKGRFSVRRVEKKDKTLVGFREQDPRFVADLSQCLTVIPEIGSKVGAMATFIETLDGKRDIPQIEFIAGDEAIMLTIRHMQPLTEADRAAWTAFGQEHGFAISLQPGGVESVQPLWPAEVPLSFKLAPWDVELAFRPLDFIQVNASLNVKMIALALELLEAGPDERVLDLFCGLGNFTLPLARTVRDVVGVEGDAGLVARARENAERNGLANAQFHAADLTQDQRNAPWMRQGFDKLLLDPPRSGAIEVLQQLPLKQFKRIVYVSCHPGSLARDAGYLVNEQASPWSVRVRWTCSRTPRTWRASRSSRSAEAGATARAADASHRRPTGAAAYGCGALTHWPSRQANAMVCSPRSLPAPARTVHSITGASSPTAQSRTSNTSALFMAKVRSARAPASCSRASRAANPSRSSTCTRAVGGTGAGR